MFLDENIQELDPKFVEACIEKMDKDVATRFVMSALSLKKDHIYEAFTTACKEMQIRLSEKEKKSSQTKQPMKSSMPESQLKDLQIDTGDDNVSVSSGKDLLKVVDDLLSSVKKKYGSGSK